MQFKPKPRLQDFDYRGYYRYFITMCTDRKMKLFENDEQVKSTLEILANESLKYSFKVWAYCFMPDHLHLLLEGDKTDADMKSFVKVFKQKTGYLYNKESTMTGNGGKMWQSGYYDHVLRNDEDTYEVLKYILNNPVRKGLVNNYTDYCHTGSFVIDIRTIDF
jgi:putative transposase